MQQQINVTVNVGPCSAPCPAVPGDPHLYLAVKDKPPGIEKGICAMSLALAFNDRQFAEGTLTPSIVDQDGKAIVDAAGAPLDPASIPVSWSSSDTAVVDPFGSVGQSFNLESGNPGMAKVTASIGPYPAGQIVTFDFDCIVGNSAPGDPTVAVEIRDET